MSSRDTSENISILNCGGRGQSVQVGVARGGSGLYINVVSVPQLSRCKNKKATK